MMTMTKKMKTKHHKAVLNEKHGDEIAAILAKFPPDQKRSAILPLLYIAQHEYGYITNDAVDEVAEILELDPTQVGSLIGFYTLLHDEEEGRVAFSRKAKRAVTPRVAARSDSGGTRPQRRMRRWNHSTVSFSPSSIPKRGR